MSSLPDDATNASTLIQGAKQINTQQTSYRNGFKDQKLRLGSSFFPMNEWELIKEFFSRFNFEFGSHCHIGFGVKRFVVSEIC